MLTNTGPVAKLYLSIIDDVIDSMRELFLDEGVEERVLDDLKHLWETKVMQSKAMEDYRKNNINSSNFVLQLPPGYQQTEQERTGIPANHNMKSLPVKSNSGSLATFSLPSSLAYPVQIPAGVTLQTASGQLFKVNVPVVVTHAPAGQQPTSHHQPHAPHHKTDWGDASAPAPQSSAVPLNPIRPHFSESSTLPAPSYPDSRSGVQFCQESSLPQIDLTQGGNEPTAPPEPARVQATASPCTQLLELQICAEEALARTAQGNAIDDILKEVIEGEREKTESAKTQAAGNSGSQSETTQVFNSLSDIIQLDGPADNSDHEGEEELPLEDKDFFGLSNAEAIKALEEESNSGDSSSSSSSCEEPDPLADVEEEDPLNSGDDVVEQDIPDLFDTDNVIVCQYDKIHRSRNRWKFHLKDGVICYGGRDYVFSKAVGEAVWL